MYRHLGKLEVVDASVSVEDWISGREEIDATDVLCDHRRQLTSGIHKLDRHIAIGVCDGSISAADLNHTAGGTVADCAARWSSSSI